MDKYKKVMNLAKQRGFLWSSFEIYGGARGFYDYGPLGARLKKKLEDKWREYYILEEGFFEISSPDLGVEEVFVASGHVDSFVDPMVQCKECGEAFKANELIKTALRIDMGGLTNKEIERLIKNKKVKCPDCGGNLGKVWNYSLMFKTYVGPGKKKVGYLRPETAQGIFISFPRLYRFFRKKLPFGIAQIGRAYRNEISPRQGIIRLREFTLAEVEIFVNPKEKAHRNFERYAKKLLKVVPEGGKEKALELKEMVKRRIVGNELLAYHMLLTKRFLEDVGIPEERIRFRQHSKSEMAHYAQDCWDAEVLTEGFGWIEVVGIADRGDYDLRAHEKKSGEDMKAYIQYEKPKRIERYLVKPDMPKIALRFKDSTKKIARIIKDLGDSGISNFIDKGYIEVRVDNRKIRLDKDLLTLKKVVEKVSGEKIMPHVIEPSYGMDRIFYCVLESSYCKEGDRVIMKFKNSITPIEAGVFSLVNKEELIKKSKEVYALLREKLFLCYYDTSGSIGRRYARLDEIGVPYAITIDFDTLKDNTVTIRERDSTEQVRVKIDELSKVLDELLKGKIEFKELIQT